MNDVVGLGLILLLATSGYAAGRVHGQFSYRWGYRNGYRQGYFDGDRASWNRRRRDLQAAVASVLNSVSDPAVGLGAAGGSVYTSTARGEDDLERGDEPEPVEEPESVEEPETDVAAAPRVPRGRHARMEGEGRALAEVTTE
jgi:hypothetical protein